MKLTARDIAVLLVVVINLTAVFYWGGTTRARVDAQGETIMYFMRRAEVQHAEFQAAITDLTVRISVTEALHQGE